MSFIDIQIGCQKGSKFDFQNQFYSLLIHVIKVQLFWEDHKISQLSSNCFDKSADLLSKCQNKWKITPNFCGLLRNPEL